MENKKGFFSVYACLFLLVLVMAAGVFIAAAKKSTIHGTAMACSSLWSQSILAEYDLNLQQRYHLFGYYGYPDMVRDKLEFYADESFGEKRNADITIMTCSLYDHSLRNVEVFGQQVISSGKLALTGTFDKPAKAIQSITHHHKPGHQTLFSDLPSQGCKTGLSLSSLTQNYDGADDLKGIAKKGTDAYFQMVYIFSHFKNQRSQQDLGETYLQYEVEYIVGGKGSDHANQQTVKGRIIALREAVNLVFLQKDPVKSAAVYAAAELLTPASAAATAQSIMSAWAYAESVNDYNLLVSGYTVPKVKTADAWATDLDAVLAEDDVEGCIYTGTKNGDTYEDYLRLLLLTMENSTRLLRMMDLIQINMRYSYYDAFLIGDYYGGVSYTYNINGETCHVEETYE